MKSVKKFFAVALTAISLLSTGMAQALTVNGAGATFPYPIYSKWFYEYNKATGVQINYQSIGSGGGVQQYTAKTVDFGASDAFLTTEETDKVKGAVLHIPTVIGAVVLAYNVPGVESGLKLTPEAVVGIFMGDISKWNDSAIADANPDAKLPDLAINVAHRSDGSGTTNIFTNYLTKVSTKWASGPGFGKAVKWPTGVGGKGNEGVAGLIQQIPGTIGYIELAYAVQNKLAYAKVRNRAGNFVEPSVASTTAAAAGALKHMPGDFKIMITNAPGAESYPISGFTWLLIRPQYDAAMGKALVEFLDWAMVDGQKMVSDLYYAPLPDSLVEKIKAKVKSIKY
jgi:phosphate transport system substrate-binding protein